MDGTQVIAVCSRALQKSTGTVLLANKEAHLARPATIGIPVPEFIPGQPQSAGYAERLRQVQPDLVASAALAAAEARGSPELLGAG